MRINWKNDILLVGFVYYFDRQLVDLQLTIKNKNIYKNRFADNFESKLYF